MSDNQNPKEKLNEALNALFPSPEVASKVCDLIVHNKPRGWGKRSQAPYYKEIYANQMRKDIEKMMETHRPIVYRYAIWCDEGGMSAQTLYNRINQSIRYLIEQMDTPDRRFAAWYESVSISREKGIGITIEFVPGMYTGTGEFTGEIAIPKSELPKWKQVLDNYLESDTVAPFHLSGLLLSPDDIVTLKAELGGLSNIIFDVTSSEIKVIKTN